MEAHPSIDWWKVETYIKHFFIKETKELRAPGGGGYERLNKLKFKSSLSVGDEA